MEEDGGLVSLMEVLVRIALLADWLVIIADS
jgi:hypothetical protein